ncbi:MAG: hypothetical protein SGBAC_010877 [Bacillariaceae sp.]
MSMRFALTPDERKSSAIPNQPTSEDTVTSVTYSRCTNYSSVVSGITMSNRFDLSNRFDMINKDERKCPAGPTRFNPEYTITNVTHGCASFPEDDQFSVVSGITMSNRFDTMNKDERKSPAGPSRPLSEDAVTKSMCRCDSFEEDHFSVVSGITMDDALGISYRLDSSDRYQYRLDPRLHSLKEQKWASDPELEDTQQRFDTALRFPGTTVSRFFSEGADTKLCAAPLRRLSMSYRSAYKSSSSDLLDQLGSSHHKSTDGNLDHLGSSHHKSTNSNLDLLTSSHHKATFSNLDFVRSSSQHESASGDLDYRTSEQWSDSSFFLDEECLEFGEHVYENDESSSSFEEPLLGKLEALEEQTVEDLKGESEPHNTPCPCAEPRRSYHKSSRANVPISEVQRASSGRRSANFRTS